MFKIVYIILPTNPTNLKVFQGPLWDICVTFIIEEKRPPASIILRVSSSKQFKCSSDILFSNVKHYIDEELKTKNNKKRPKASSAKSIGTILYLVSLPMMEGTNDFQGPWMKVLYNFPCFHMHTPLTVFI